MTSEQAANVALPALGILGIMGVFIIFGAVLWDEMRRKDDD